MRVRLCMRVIDPTLGTILMFVCMPVWLAHVRRHIHVCMYAYVFSVCVRETSVLRCEYAPASTSSLSEAGSLFSRSAEDVRPLPARVGLCDVHGSVFVF